jgi:hypothetical protein
MEMAQTFVFCLCSLQKAYSSSASSKVMELLICRLWVILLQQLKTLSLPQVQKSELRPSFTLTSFRAIQVMNDISFFMLLGFPCSYD